MSHIQPSETGAPTALLVDDEPDLRHLCRRALEEDQWRVVEAGDGQKALELIQDWSGPLDLVITDLAMPRIGGREVAEVLSIFHPRLPVLAITGDPGRADRRLPTLLKPFTVEALIEASTLMRYRAIQMRVSAGEKRIRARHARRIAAEMTAKAHAMRNQVDLVTVAFELQRLDRLKGSKPV